MVGPSKYRREVEKDLVAEQPGLGLALIGILIGVLIGLAIKVTIAPDRVRVHIDEALSRIPQKTLDQVHIQIGETSLSLSQGIWPDFSLVIKDVKISSSNVCWLAPQIEINEIRLPLSWSQLFFGKIDVHELQADEVDLSLRNAPDDCDKNKKVESADLTTPGVIPLRTVADAGSASTPKPSANPIRKISVRKFLIHYLPVAFTTLQIDSFETNILSQEPKLIDFSGKLNLDGDTLVGDYASHASWKVRFDEAQGPLWTLSAKGDWREGRYDLSAFYSQDKKTYEGHFELKHLPLSQLLPLLAKYRLMENDYNGRQIWLAGKIETSGSVENWEKNPVHVSNVKIDGDLGDIQTPKIEFHSLKPVTFDPINLDLHGVSLHQLLVILNRPDPSPALGDLGTFNGVASIENANHIRIRGDHSGLEFIFSNRGAREKQTISLLSGEAELRNNHWKVKIDRIRPLEGVFDGVIEMQADQNWRDLEIETKVDEVSLSPNVQTLMTGGGNLGALSGKMKAELVGGNLKTLEGLLKSDRVLVEGMRIEKPKLAFSTQKEKDHENFFLDVNAQEMEIESNSTPGMFLSKVLTLPSSSSGESDQFLFKNTSARFQTRNLEDLQWTSFQSLIPQGMIRSQGGWSVAGDLFGQISVREQRKETRWLIRGDRGTPLLQKVSP